ncbi:phage portal protein [Paenibacillus selenitireducens]|uniref:Phage portal protein n=2 Tax=Paenibacillus selenitireducens TaxID=1324314 RepID=A0A1T2XK24_9BACL|nr:phage portal protein [Paenibacillus selenitireducens]
MKSYLPSYLSGSEILGAMLDTEAVEVSDVNTSIEDVLNQFYIDTATWGLDRWEKMCGIATDLSKPLDQRRSVIKSKLRGIGTVTVEHVKNVAEAFANGEVDVAEDVAHHMIIVTFVGKLGRPPNMDDIKNALRDIIPAHLGIEYVFKYYLYNDLLVENKKYENLTKISYENLINKGVS